MQLQALEVRWLMLGGIGAVVDGELMIASGRQRRAVLALLIVHRNRVVPIERLIDEIWPDEPPRSARNTIQRFVSDLRNQLGQARSRIETTPGGYRLSVEPGEIDLDQLEQEASAALAGARAGDGTWAALTEAIDRLGQPVLPGAEHLRAAKAERERVSTLQVRLMEQAGELALSPDHAGIHHLDSVDDLQRWVAENPLNERLTVQLMTALTRAGRQSDALAVCARLRDRLQTELGVSVSPAVSAAELDILQQREAMRPSKPTEERPASALVGRDDLLRRIAGHLSEQRLMTLVGPGGSGKTSLAIEVARAWSTGEVAIVYLADLSSELQVVEAVAAAIGVDPTEREDPARLVAAIGSGLANWPGLVVIDNAEHVIDAVAELAQHIMEVPGPARIMVTSREHLAIPNEFLVEVGPLGLPAPGRPAAESAAVRLFAQRGAAMGRFDHDTLLNDQASATICERLDGLPLAIELAAAQLRALTPEDLAARMAQPLQLLGGRRVNHRQTSVEALLDWSWDLLNADEQRLLAHLSAFNGWPLAAVEHLEPERGIALLTSLVAKSLVQTSADIGGSTRYVMLETLRHHARSKAAEHGWPIDSVQADWVLTEARRHTMPESFSVIEAIETIDDERHNVLAAIRWMADAGCSRDLVELVARAGGAFGHRGPVIEGRQWFALATDRLDDPDHRCPQHGIRHEEPSDLDRRGALLTMSSSLASAAGDMDKMIGDSLAAIELGGSEPFDWLPETLAITAILVEATTLNGQSEHLLELAERLAPSTRSAAVNQAQVTAWRGSWELMHRNHDEALAHFDRAIAHDGRPSRAMLLAHTGRLAALHLTGRHREAIDLADELAGRGDTDVWHYTIDLLRAVCVGAVDPAGGARILEAVVGLQLDEELLGRSDDVRIATGVVARWAGDRDRCIDLLSRPFGRMPALITLMVEYAEGDRPPSMSHHDWCQRWSTIIQARIRQIGQRNDEWIQTQPKEQVIRDTIDELRSRP